MAPDAQEAGIGSDPPNPWAVRERHEPRSTLPIRAADGYLGEGRPARERAAGWGHRETSSVTGQAIAAAAA